MFFLLRRGWLLVRVERVGLLSGEEVCYIEVRLTDYYFSRQYKDDINISWYNSIVKVVLTTIVR